ncbi:MAG: site-specific integrase, partial [Pseudonocardiaceae bacterium]
MADGPEVITGKQLLDQVKRRGFVFARIAPGPDGPIEGIRENDQWRDVIHIGGFSSSCYAWRERSVQLTLSRLRSALDSAVHRRLIEFNVAAPVRCPSQVRADREPWTATEVKTFLTSLAGERLHAVMLLSLLGLRPAEVCGLRWADVDLDADTLRNCGPVRHPRTAVTCWSTSWAPHSG